MLKGHLYIELSSDQLASCPRRYICVLTADGAQATRTVKGKAAGSCHGATLTAISDGLARFRAGSRVTVHIRDRWVAGMWKDALKTFSSGGTVKPEAEWRSALAAAEGKDVALFAGEHEFTEWSHYEMEHDGAGS